MTLHSTLGAAALASLALLTTGAAHAASYTGYASADNFNALDRRQDTQSGTTADPASYSVDVDGNTASSVTHSAAGGSVYSTSHSVNGTLPDGTPFSGGAGASTRVSYQVTLSGPASAFVVPVHVVASGFVNGAGSTQASVSFVVNYDSGGASAALLAGTVLGSPSGNSFSFDQVAMFKANSTFDVYLSADSGSGGPGNPTGWSEAFVDPSFTIDDPALAALYHFEGIPGQVPAVPEPASWALMLAGLGLAVTGASRRAREVPGSRRIRLR